MESMNLGKLVVSADESGVTIAVGDEGVTITPRQVTAVEDFLRRCAPRERRVGFRVPIGPLNDAVREQLKIRVRKGRGRVDATPVDFSLTGILIRATDIVAAAESRIALEMEFAGHFCTVIGAVVRCEGDLMAIHFIDTLKNGELDPPEELLAIYHALEQEWLKSRVV